MDTVSIFMAFYSWVKDPVFVFDIGKTIVEGATYDIFKKLGASFVSRIRPFFSSEDEAQKYFEQICVSTSINAKNPNQDIINLFDKFTANKLDERVKQQFGRELRQWFSDHSDEITKILKETKPINEIDLIVYNFIDVYRLHGIPKSNIINMIPSEFGLKIKDFRDNESIMNIITPELLEWTSSFFNIHIAWLYGTSEKLYRCKSYLGLQELFNLVLEIKYIKEKNVKAHFLKAAELDYNSDIYQRMALFLRYQIATVNDKPIYKYIPIGREWNWGWENSRYEIKHIIYFFEKIGVDNIGHNVNSNIISNLIFGAIFPEGIADNKENRTWNPEDYVDLPSESRYAKEIQETQKCRADFYQRGYKKNISLEIDRIISDEGYRKYKESLLFNFK
ncbi:hypothetical protein [Propionispora vibrioides]|uniref:Uncharacterized protein n=1 Tax=Propionispora vibrioides TaxID=112903 RepID=A0A1H8VFQ0_9FIRM|nr:hypothetical protein [Propionispora vibrioides]SEP14123.1 hypothetical protein SAMN04490178_11162 [Propionispora vibrioides]